MFNKREIWYLKANAWTKDPKKELLEFIKKLEN